MNTSDLNTEYVQYKRELMDTIEKYGKKHTNVAICFNKLGMLLERMWRMQEAKSAYEKALAICEGNHGLYHLSVAQSVHLLGHWHLATSDLLEAKKHFERLIDVLANIDPPPEDDFVRAAEFSLDAAKYLLNK